MFEPQRGLAILLRCAYQPTEEGGNHWMRRNVWDPGIGGGGDDTHVWSAVPLEEGMIPNGTKKVGTGLTPDLPRAGGGGGRMRSWTKP